MSKNQKPKIPQGGHTVEVPENLKPVKYPFLDYTRQVDLQKVVDEVEKKGGGK